MNSTKNINITLVTSDKSLEDRLNNIFGMYENCDLTTIHRQLDAATLQVIGSSQPNLVILEIRPEQQHNLEILETIKKSDIAGIPIVVISDDLNVSAIRKLLHTGVTDWLPKDAPDNDLIWSLEKAVEKHPFLQDKAEDNTEAVFYAFLPAMGGVGNTTLTIQYASLLKNKYKSQRSICIVDLNLQAGTVADYLNLKPALQIDEIAMSPERLDTQLLEIMLSKHENGLNVLCAPRAATTSKVYSKNLIESLLSLVSEMFDHVVIDLPHTWHPWTDSVLHGSNELFVVTEFTVPALRYAKTIIDEVQDKLVEPLHSQVLINKYHQNLFGSGLVKKDAIELMGQNKIIFIPEDKSLVEESINRGEPLSVIHGGNKIDKQLIKVIDQSIA